MKELLNILAVLLPLIIISLPIGIVANPSVPNTPEWKAGGHIILGNSSVETNINNRISEHKVQIRAKKGAGADIWLRDIQQLVYQKELQVDEVIILSTWCFLAETPDSFEQRREQLRHHVIRAGLNPIIEMISGIPFDQAMETFGSSEGREREEVAMSFHVSRVPKLNETLLPEIAHTLQTRGVPLIIIASPLHPKHPHLQDYAPFAQELTEWGEAQYIPAPSFPAASFQDPWHLKPEARDAYRSLLEGQLAEIYSVPQR